MEEGVLALHEQVLHGEARCDVGQEPQGMAEHGKQSHVGKRHGRLIPELELVNRGRHVLAAHEVQPHLNIAFELKLRSIAFAFSGEEDVKVELVGIGVERNALNVLRHLVGEHDHARERRIGVGALGGLPGGFRGLFVRVGPVEDLLLDELARVEGAERRARQEQEVLGDDRQPGLVLFVAGDLDILVDGLLVVLANRGEELARGVSPRAEVVLVEDDEVPVG